MPSDQNMKRLTPLKTLSDFVVIGEVGCGKTALMNALLENGNVRRKTQAAEFHQHNVIDTPGEFVGRPAYYGALLSTIINVTTLVYLQAANKEYFSMPSGLLSVYSNKRVIGVISKADLPDANVSGARRLLKENGIPEPYFVTSVVNNKGIASLRSHLLALQDIPLVTSPSQQQINVA